jgi:hypothetical protein
MVKLKSKILLTGGVLIMNPAWLFVIATIIAVFGILVSFKKRMGYIQSKIEERQVFSIETFQKEQTRFFISIAIVEAVPIFLIVYGFIQIEQSYGQTFNIILPLIIIITILIIALVYLLVIRRDTLGMGEIPKESRNIVNTFVLIAAGLISAFPAISVIALLM